jgi:methylase of polypeptide subunit release factors
MKNEEILKMNKGKKFDIILANPPFNLGERMLIKWFDIANEICTV